MGSTIGMDEPLPIRCARVTLRRLAMADAPAIAAYRADPGVAKYQSWETYTLARAEELCCGHAGAIFGRAGTWFQLAIVRNDDGKLVGDCGLHFLSDDIEQLEIGITLSPAQQGRGLAGEAIAGVLDLAFGPLRMHRVTARTDAENVKAAALFTRLGFRQEARFMQCARFKGAWCDELLFAVLDREWTSGHHSGRTERPT